MPLLGFSVFREQIEDGSKRQTIRLARKHQIKEGDTLYLYWKLRTKQCKKIGETVCTESYRVPWFVIRSDVDVAHRDGFIDLFSYHLWFYSYSQLTANTIIDIIRWSYPLQKNGVRHI